jgi:nucleoside-diphosphate-sugar epimerase
MSRDRVVAVTGATGFLGLHLIPALARAGAHIRILTRRSTAHPAWQGIAFETVCGSLEDAGALEQLVTGVDAVVHVAGLIKARNRAEFLRTNQGGSGAIATAARRYAPQAQFVAVSSLAAREPQLSDYAFSKRMGEDAARAAYADAPHKLTIIRPPAIYGPWDRETLKVFRAVTRSFVPVFGQNRATIIHAADAAAAITAIATGDGPSGVYTLADDHPQGYTMAELLAEAARATGHSPRFIRVPDGVVRAAGHISGWRGRWRGQTPIFTAGKAREVLHPDWSISPTELLPANVHTSKIDLAGGFASTVAWYRRAGWLD